MNIKKVTGKVFTTNSYIVWNENECAVIDCGESIDDLMNAIGETNVLLKHILLTHGHFDHLLTANELRKRTGAPIIISELDREKTSDARKNLAMAYLPAMDTFEADIFVKDGDVLKICGEEFKVIATPGHTLGCVCYLAGKNLFAGDTLFKGTVGHFAANNKTVMKSSIEKLFELNDDISVYSGHGEDTTIGYERIHNPFANSDREWR